MATRDLFEVSVSHTAMAANATIAPRATQTCAASVSRGRSGSTTFRPKMEAAASSSSDPGTSANKQTVPASRPTDHAG